jgi:hypothetical protein
MTDNTAQVQTPAASIISTAPVTGVTPYDRDAPPPAYAVTAESSPTNIQTSTENDAQPFYGNPGLDLSGASAPKRQSSPTFEKWNLAEKAMRDAVANDPTLMKWSDNRVQAFRHEANLEYGVLKNLPNMKFPGKWKGTQYLITAATAAALVVYEGFCIDNTAIKSVQNLGILCGPVGSGGNGVLGIDVDVKGMSISTPPPKADATWEEVYKYTMDAGVMHLLRTEWVITYIALNPACADYAGQEAAWQQWLQLTRIVLTPSGGFHIYARVEGDDCGLSVAAGKIKADDGSVIDIRWTSATGKVGQLAGPTSVILEEKDATGAIVKRGGIYVCVWNYDAPATKLAVVPNLVKKFLAGSKAQRFSLHGTSGLQHGEVTPGQPPLTNSGRESITTLGAKLIYFLERWDEELLRDPNAVHPCSKRDGAFYTAMMGLASAVRNQPHITLNEALEVFEAFCRRDPNFDAYGLESNLYQLSEAARDYDGKAIEPASIHAMAENWRHMFDDSLKATQRK